MTTWGCGSTEREGEREERKEWNFAHFLVSLKIPQVFCLKEKSLPLIWFNFSLQAKFQQQLYFRVYKAGHCGILFNCSEKELSQCSVGDLLLAKCSGLEMSHSRIVNIIFCGLIFGRSFKEERIPPGVRFPPGFGFCTAAKEFLFYFIF